MKALSRSRLHLHSLKGGSRQSYSLFGANAIAGGGEVVRDGGIVYTYAGITQHGMLAFPV